MTKATFDWEKCLQLSNNKEDLAKELIAMFKNELPGFQVALKKAIQSNDANQLQHQSHKLRGACSYISVPRLLKLTEQLESQIKSHNQDQLNGLVNQINREIDEVLKAIKSI